MRRYIHIYTYGNGFTTSGLKRGGIQAMPTGQEILDVRSSGVHDAKTCDVDGAVLDHLAFPSVVHYLITAKHTQELLIGTYIHEGTCAVAREMQGLFSFARAIRIVLRSHLCLQRVLKNAVCSFAKSVRLTTAKGRRDP